MYQNGWMALRLRGLRVIQEPEERQVQALLPRSG